MSQSVEDRFRQFQPSVDTDHPQYVPQLVNRILAGAVSVGASDVHLVPDPSTLQMLWRMDGVLQPVAQFPSEIKANVVARLKVLAELLTYQTDRPQEGRIRADGSVEMRVSTFPTVHGEKAVIRLFVGSNTYRHVSDLGLPTDVVSTLSDQLLETSGVILLTGPAGSGKTTTIYACLRDLAKSQPPRSLVSLEDPVEAVLDGVAQSQIRAASEFDYATGLRSLMRQDPDVIVVGEIRDPETAATVFQAALTGQLVLTTFHSSSASAAVSRLADMQIEPYLLRSALKACLCQHLLRRLCRCAEETDDEGARLGLPVERCRLPRGCDDCSGTGYDGRLLIVEFLQPDLQGTGRAILSRSDAKEIEDLAVASGMTTCRQRACAAVELGHTSAAEVRRVLGVSHSQHRMPSPVDG